LEKKIKILQLSPQFPFPMDDGGKISIGNLTKQFSNFGADITLFCYSNNTIANDLLEQAKKYCKIEIYQHSTKNTIYRILKSIIFNQSIYLSKHIDKKIQTKLKQILSKEQFDIIHTDHTCMAPLAFYAQSLTNIPIGLRLHNIEWIIWKRYSQNIKSNLLKRHYINNQAEILKIKEKEFIEKSDVTFTISDIDLSRAKEIAPKANIYSAPAGVDLEYWKPLEHIERNNKELIIATTYKWIHNVDALKWFLDFVFPLVMKVFPDIQLTLLGKDPPTWLKHYYPQNLNVIGYVEDVRTYLNRANIYIAPLFVGSGIRIKILEAMAMELPVIATTVSAEGIKATSSDGLFICDEPVAFANTIVQLIKTNSQTRELGKSARNFINEHFIWENTVKFILHEYSKLVISKK